MRIDAEQALKSGVRLALAAAVLLAGPASSADPQGPPSPYRLMVSPVDYTPMTNGEQYRLGPTHRPSTAVLAQKPFGSEIGTAARNAGLDPALLHAVIHVESRYRADALSPKGAMGLMQVMPATGARFGVPHPDLSVAANLRAGSLYLQNLMQQFDGRLDLVLAAYNAGEGAVVRHAMTIPPYPETRRYVPAVMAKYEEWRVVETSARRIDYLAGTRLTPITLR